MRITPSISTLSALLVILFASATVWTSSASAATDSSEHAAVKQAQSKSHKRASKKANRKLKAAQRPKKLQSARRLQPTRGRYRAPAGRYASAAVQGRTPGYNWSTTATYGRSVPQTGRQSIAPQAQTGLPAQSQPTAPQVQPGQVPATVCYSYNPCTTCWSTPYYQSCYQWSAPAAYGGAPQPAAAPQTYALPPAQPAPSYAQPPAQPARAPTGYCEAVQQPQAAPAQTTVCYNTSWWSTWPLSYLSGWCY